MSPPSTAVDPRWALTETWLRAYERGDYTSMIRVTAIAGALIMGLNPGKYAAIYWAREYAARTRNESTR